MSKKTALVISAHAADFVWRAGGAIALHQAKGYEVTIVCLSYGERGESAKIWKEPGVTLDKVKTARRVEAENAAKALDAHDIQFFDLGDYPLEMDKDAKFRLVDVIRKVMPTFMMSHSLWDPYNTDHMNATRWALECRMIAQAWGHNPHEKVLGAPQLYLFEPHQTELSGFVPTTFVDITAVFPLKVEAMEAMKAQQYLRQHYAERAEHRANHARRISGRKDIKYAETFQRVYPQVTDTL